MLILSLKDCAADEAEDSCDGQETGAEPSSAGEVAPELPLSECFGIRDAVDLKHNHGEIIATRWAMVLAGKRLAFADDADAMVGEFRVHFWEVVFGHVAGDTIFVADGAGWRGASVIGLS